MVDCQKQQQQKNLDPFNLPKEAVVHPWLILTIRELNMPCVITIGPVEFVPEKLIDQIKEELAKATTIIKESRDGVVDSGDVGVGEGEGDDVDLNIVVDIVKQTVADLVDKRRDDDNGIGGGVSGYTPIGGGGKTTYIPYRFDIYSSVRAGTSKVPSCSCECNTCKQKMDDLINKVKEWTQVRKDTNLILQKFISKRSVNPSKKIISSYTPIGINKRAKIISKVLADCRARKSATPQKSIDTPITEVGPIVLKR